MKAILQTILVIILIYAIYRFHKVKEGNMRISDIDELEEPFRDKIKTLMENVNSRLKALADDNPGYIDIYAVVFETLRTKERQKQLYNKGYSKTMKSKHLLGKAADIVPQKNGQWTWDLKDEYVKKAYMIIGEEARKLGLTWGGDWRSFRDYPHVETD